MSIVCRNALVYILCRVWVRIKVKVKLRWPCIKALAPDLHSMRDDLCIKASALDHGDRAGVYLSCYKHFSNLFLFKNLMLLQTLQNLKLKLFQTVSKTASCKLSWPVVDWCFWFVQNPLIDQSTISMSNWQKEVIQMRMMMEAIL